MIRMEPSGLESVSSAEPWVSAGLLSLLSHGKTEYGLALCRLEEGPHQNGDTLVSVFLSPESDKLLLFELYLA